MASVRRGRLTLPEFKRVLLRVDDLRTFVVTGRGEAPAVDGVSLRVAAGETVALVGESGSGKSLTALSIIRLLPEGARIASGHVMFEGRDLASAAEPTLRAVRGARIGMVFQEPMTSLNPVLSVGFQVAEPLRVHRGLSRSAARRRAVELLARVGIAEPERRCDRYPHELSGGMRQRVMIAMALACEPALLIADEPTTALDVTVQAQIVALLADLQRQTGMGMLFITHNLRLVGRLADRLHVMYAGRVVESGPAREVLAQPRHPYTMALLASMPGGVAAERGRFAHISGEPPTPRARPGGCAFHPRCELGRHDAQCAAETPPLTTAADRQCACWKAEEAAVPSSTGSAV